MASYKVKKIDAITEKEIDYGHLPYNDMKLVTRGYKEDNELKGYYNRKNSRYFFYVEECN